MKNTSLRTAAATAAIVLGAAAAPASHAAVVLTGCSGGSFGNACGLDELLAGGSMNIDGNVFAGFTLGLNGGRLLSAAAIRVDVVETAAGLLGFTLVDTGNTLRAANGDLTSNDLGFSVTLAAGGLAWKGFSLLAGVGGVSGDGSYTNVYASAFNTSFTSLLGTAALLCNAPGCTNATATAAAGFAPVTAMSVVAGIDAGSVAGGLAQLSSVSVLLSPVPEPAPLALLPAGGLLAWLASRRRRSRSA